MSDIPPEALPPRESARPESMASELTKTGRISMQGHVDAPPGQSSIEGLANRNLTPESVKEIVPKEEIPEKIPGLSPPAANDLELAAQHASATKATRWHADGETGIVPEYYRLRSELTEEVAKNNVVGGIRSDAFSQAGTNFVNYDVFGTNELCSVKAYSLEKHPTGDQIRERYRDDFANLLNSESAPNREAAARLLDIRANDMATWTRVNQHLPTAVSTAETPSAMQKAIAESATLRVPEDQVEALRGDLKNQIVQDPQKFGLAVDIQQDEITQLLNKKVLTIDERYATAHYQAKAAELFAGRETELKSLNHS